MAKKTAKKKVAKLIVIFDDSASLEPAVFTCGGRIKYPYVTKIQQVVPNKVVEVTFADGEKTKAICREPDTFSLEMAITICLMKKLLGGSGNYNKTIKACLKQYQKDLEDEARAKQEAIDEEKRKAKRAAKRVQRAERRAEAAKERAIEIQKEAYIRAMKELGGNA